ncbi:MAG: inorganic diphosphatase, partial [Deltaproteobacteria bacterium]
MGEDTVPETNKTFVIGHRNPDSDSICSAIAYAELRRQQGLAGVKAARAGTINSQTQFVLDFLGIEVPKLLTDVHPRIKDVVTEKVISIHQSAPMSQALQLYHQYRIQMLPVVDDAGQAKGLLLLNQATELFLVPVEPEKLRRVQASISSIQSCLGATPQHLADPERVEVLDLHVGARREASFSRWVDEIIPQKTILITG